jgi:hypothetical protein
VSFATEAFASGGDETGGGTCAGVAPWSWPPNAANAADGEYPGVETTVAGVGRDSGGPVAAAEAYLDASVAGVAYGAKPAGGVCIGGVGAGIDNGAGIGAERHAKGPSGGGVCAFDGVAAAAARAASS